MMIVFWACLFVFFLVVELVTAGLATIWFCGGAIIALIMAVFNLPVWSQIVTFAVISILLLVLTRPIVKKLKNKNVAPTNTDRVLGRKSIVIDDIDGLSGHGSVKIDGIIWSAISESDDKVILSGTKVIVKKVDGVKVVVAPCEENMED